MNDDEIRIATEYLRRIAPMFAASVLKILHAYAEKSKTAIDKGGLNG